MDISQEVEMSCPVMVYKASYCNKGVARQHLCVTQIPPWRLWGRMGVVGDLQKILLVIILP